MTSSASPNDPVFFLHHCNIDRLWARWQATHPDAGYVPRRGGPPGHNLHDDMPETDGAGITPASMLDQTALGYDYAEA